ncbi:uncharacterized protein LOC119611189 [Lucilia sericata]|uniref:uncharacterized protein LOC119611189 n=1 Tax=Lucilia sericata TaxID=13632 RepID=UPI0018A80BDF|nr:uncharacterized protein LOC119611189 [Lucilia sericata]
MHRLNKRMRNSKDEQYTIIGDQAYTDDNILINSIFISNLSENITMQQALEYFQQFGNAYLVENNEGQNDIISFDDPKVAAVVLQKIDHMLLNCNIKIHACKSYQQPHDYRTANKLLPSSKTDFPHTAKSSSYKSYNNTMIFHLNNDCLIYICKKLELEDQINFALSCQRFAEILKVILRVYKELVIKVPCTNDKVEFFFQSMRPQVRQLWVKNVELLNMMLFCTSVESLIIVNCEAEELTYPVYHLIDKMIYLKELKFVYVEISDILMEKISTFNKIKFLNVIDCFVTGKNLHITGLEGLNLEKCCQVENQYFTIICQNHTNLNYLDIRDAELMKPEISEQISQHLKQLKTLKITNYEQNFNSIAQLPNLTHLEIKGIYRAYLPKEFFNELVKHKADKLEVLRLSGIKRETISSEIISLIAELKKLKVLYFSCHSTFDNKDLEKLSQLTELEVISLDNCDTKTDKDILKLLRNCLKLKYIELYSFRVPRAVIRSAAKLVKEQLDASLRTVPVKLFYTYMIDFKFWNKTIILGASDSNDDDNDSSESI